MEIVAPNMNLPISFYSLGMIKDRTRSDGDGCPGDSCPVEALTCRILPSAISSVECARDARGLIWLGEEGYAHHNSRVMPKVRFQIKFSAFVSACAEHHHIWEQFTFKLMKLHSYIGYCSLAQALSIAHISLNCILECQEMARNTRGNLYLSCSVVPNSRVC